MQTIKAFWGSANKEAVKRRIRRSPAMMRFYDLLTNNPHTDDKEAMLKIYGKGDSYKNYKQLKLRFQRILIDSIGDKVMIDSGVDPFAVNYNNCLSELGMIKLLLASNKRLLAVRKSTRLLPILRDFGFTELRIEVLTDLIIHTSKIDYSKNKLEDYIREMTMARELYECEKEMIVASCLTSVAFQSTRGVIAKSVLEQATAYEFQFRNYIEKGFSSQRLIRDGYIVCVMRREINGDYKGVVEIADEAKDKLSKFRKKRELNVLLFDMHRLLAFIQLKEYRLAEELGTYYSIMFDSLGRKALNWFVIKAYLLIARIRQYEYSGVEEILIEIETNQAQLKMSGSAGEFWRVLHAYAEFFLSFSPLRPKDHPPFRINKLLNEVPFYSKDKQGLNVSILIIQFLFLLKQKRYSEIEDKAASLAKYNDKYLKRGETFRQHCFLRMLLEIVKANFNRKRTERYATPILIKMKTEPIRLSQQSIEVEIIPYEDLWEMTLKLLD